MVLKMADLSVALLALNLVDSMVAVMVALWVDDLDEKKAAKKVDEKVESLVVN